MSKRAEGRPWASSVVITDADGNTREEAPHPASYHPNKRWGPSTKGHRRRLAIKRQRRKG